MKWCRIALGGRPTAQRYRMDDVHLLWLGCDNATIPTPQSGGVLASRAVREEN